MKVTVIPIVIGALGAIRKGFLKGLEDKEKSGSSILQGIKIGLNTEKNPGDLRRLTVTQTPVKNHQRELMWKIRKGVK